MALELSNVKLQLQNHLQEGLLLVVGTGLSIAEGIPGMWSLGTHLNANDALCGRAFNRNRAEASRAKT